MALVLTAAVALSLYWGFLRDDSALTANGMRVELDVRNLPDGPAPGTFDGGQAALSSVFPADPGATFAVRNGRLTYRPTIPEVTAAYFSTPDMGQPITSMGATFVFEPGQGTVGGAVALIVSRGVQKAIPQVVTPLPIHYVVTPRNWTLSLTRTADIPLETIAAEDFAVPLAEDGTTTYQTSLEIQDGQLIIHLPDGNRRTVRDSRISEWLGNFATFEVYSNNGLSDAVGGFEHIWADSTGRG